MNLPPFTDIALARIRARYRGQAIHMGKVTQKNREEIRRILGKSARTVPDMAKVEAFLRDKR